MGSKSLGQLGGKPKADERDTFDWFDETALGLGNVSSLVMMDFVKRAGSIQEDDARAAFALLDEAFRQIVIPEDFDRFWAESLRQRQEATDLMALMNRIIEARSERPTRRRPGSLSGRRSTATKSPVGSGSHKVSRKAQDRLERLGRADLAVAVRDVREAEATA